MLVNKRWCVDFGNQSIAGIEGRRTYQPSQPWESIPAPVPRRIEMGDFVRDLLMPKEADAGEDVQEEAAEEEEEVEGTVEEDTTQAGPSRSRERCPSISRERCPSAARLMDNEVGCRIFHCR